MTVQYSNQWTGFDGQLSSSTLTYQANDSRSIPIPTESGSTVVPIVMNSLLSDNLVIEYTYNLKPYPESEFKNFLDKKSSIFQSELLNYNLVRLFLVNNSTSQVGFVSGDSQQLSDLFDFNGTDRQATARLDYRFGDRAERTKEILDVIATDDNRRFVPNAIRRTVPKYAVQQTATTSGTICCFNFIPDGLTTLDDYSVWNDGAYIKFDDEELTINKKGTTDYLVFLNQENSGAINAGQGYQLNSSSITLTSGQQNIILHLWT